MLEGVGFQVAVVQRLVGTGGAGDHHRLDSQAVLLGDPRHHFPDLLVHAAAHSTFRGLGSAEKAGPWNMAAEGIAPSKRLKNRPRAERRVRLPLSDGLRFVLGQSGDEKRVVMMESPLSLCSYESETILGTRLSRANEYLVESLLHGCFHMARAHMPAHADCGKQPGCATRGRGRTALLRTA